ncbi:biotin carboxylase [Saccharothrix saharensis]|uniref:Biotin carboxylase n=1 Tax=Saccharothrix saharensis TaxID=571190 RepID=A0A543JQW1_9PSEU|nr:ATP-grasp domain-containing protein [Saccharothrix saharensis]TQM85251.1 biotin carboxylase [Saccharothrix saharensis]
MAVKSIGDGHVVVLNRWRDSFAEYARYLDHDVARVTYVTTDVGRAAVPPNAREVVVVADLLDHAEVRAALEPALRDHGRPEAVVALQESDFAVAAALREEFSARGRTRADLHHFLDKHAMLLAAQRTGVPVPRFELVTDAAGLTRFAGRVGWPVVVKSLQGRASTGVRRLDSADAVDRLDVPFDAEHPLVAQEYLPHRIYHVDGVHLGGGVLGPWRLNAYLNVPGGVTRGPLAFAMGEPVGSVEVDDPTVLAEVEKFLRVLVPGMSVDPWVFHLELFLTPDGEWVFLEVGCRPGGGEIPFVWRDVHRVDLMECEFSLQCGETPELAPFDADEPVGGCLHVPLDRPAPCRVVAAESMVSFDGPYSEAIPAVGTVIPRTAGSYEFVGGRFRHRGGSTAEVAARVLATAATYRVVSEPVRVAVIGSRVEVVQAAADLGLDVTLVHFPDRYDRRSDELCAKVLTADLIAEPDRVVELLRREHAERPFTRVLTLTEPGLLPAARLNAEWGLGGNSVETVRLLKDKALMRDRLAEVGLSPVRYRTVRGEEELLEFLIELDGVPVVVKPPDSGGSDGVALVVTPQDVPTAWRRVEGSGRTAVLAEEYLDGPEISVEAFSQDGVHTVVALTDKVLGTGFVEVGHAVPATLTEPTRRRVRELTTALLDAVGLVEGPSHTEIKLTGRGPRIVESHNRVGGDFIPDLVRLVHGVDLQRLAVGVPLGLVPWRPGPRPAEGGAAVRFLLAEPGTVTDVTVPGALDPAVSLTVTAEPGTEVPPLRWSDDRVCGHVIATGADATEALARCEDAVSQVRIGTRAG